MRRAWNPRCSSHCHLAMQLKYRSIPSWPDPTKKRSQSSPPRNLRHLRSSWHCRAYDTAGHPKLLSHYVRNRFGSYERVPFEMMVGQRLHTGINPSWVRNRRDGKPKSLKNDCDPFSQAPVLPTTLYVGGSILRSQSCLSACFPWIFWYMKQKKCWNVSGCIYLNETTWKNRKCSGKILCN